jgi:hypothetical protein
MRAFFVGGPIDNSELDLDPAAAPPAHYPPNTGSGTHRYRLERSVRRDGAVLYAVYAPPELPADEVERVVSERRYEARFPA